MTDEKKDKSLIKGVAWLDPSLDKPDLPVEMDLLWNQYQASGDTECLAKAAEIVPFFGKPEIGHEIAKLLRDKHSTKKLERAIQWSEIDFMFEAVIFFLYTFTLIFLLSFEIYVLAWLTLNLPISFVTKRVCLFKLLNSTLSKSTIPIVPTPDVAR